MKIVVCFMPQLIYVNKFEILRSPPMVIYLLYSILKKSNYDAVIVDPFEFCQFENEDNIIQACYEYLRTKISDDDIICFSSNTFNWGLTRTISNKLSNDNPDQKIIYGGLHPSILDEHALKVTKAALVIRAEGEKKLVEVIEALVSHLPLSEIKGITYRDGDAIIRNPDEAYLTPYELQESPLPDYSMIPANAKYNCIPIESSRGCMFSCAFCSIPHRHNWRGIDTESFERRVRDAITYEHLFSPKAEVLLVDDCFTADTKRAEAIVSKMKSWIGDKKYFIEVRASDVVKSDLFNMISDQTNGMQIGVECGYDEGLKKIRKGLTIERLYAALNKLYENGYTDRILLSFIIGFPWEGLEEINRTLDTIEDIADKFGVVCNISWLGLLPSDLWNEREKYGITVDESIYDDPLWLNDESVFFACHPLLTKDIIAQVEDRIRGMQEKKLTVFSNVLLFKDGGFDLLNKKIKKDREILVYKLKKSAYKNREIKLLW